MQAAYSALGPAKAQMPMPPMSPDGVTSGMPPNLAEPSGVTIPASRPFDSNQVSTFSVNADNCCTPLFHSHACCSCMAVVPANPLQQPLATQTALVYVLLGT